MKETTLKMALIVWAEPEDIAEYEERRGRWAAVPHDESIVLGTIPLEVIVPGVPRWGGFADGALLPVKAAEVTAAVLQAMTIVRALTSIHRWFEPSDRTR